MNGGNVAVVLVSGARGTKMGGNRFFLDTLNDCVPGLHLRVIFLRLTAV